MTQQGPRRPGPHRSRGVRGRAAVVLRVVLLVVLGTVGAALWWAPPARNLAVRMMSGWWAPAQTGQVDAGAERRAGTALGEDLRGRLVWSSNRAGNHELYLARLPGPEPVRLTDHPNVDFGARFSPDGRSIVFMRSRREWASFRDKDAWDVMLLDLDGGTARRLARRGYHPTWGPGGDSVVFARGTRVVQLELESGTERLLFDAEAAAGAAEIWDPELHPEGDLLLLAVARQGAIAAVPGTDSFRRLTDHHVCQTTWVPGTHDLLWMDAGGHGGTRVMRGTVAPRRASVTGGPPAPDSPSVIAAEVFMDLPGERSHEYFPRLSPDGAWLTWAASTGGHEHDRADYEIYVWRVGTPWDDAVRVTYFAGNDQWPDLFID